MDTRASFQSSVTAAPAALQLTLALGLVSLTLRWF